MALDPGTRVGPYDIISALGAGGMGEVYRARDTKLNREVALKILPDTFTHDPDRVARFKREAQVLASLNHPHIAQIYGLEEQEERNGQAAVAFIAMELADGEDLAQRIARGPIGVDDALPIARQIADALEAAHEQGIVHRDLKPANIKVRADGTVKVLDFGLAKALEPATAATATGTMSPTITTPAMTQAGVILGTAAYMSPEQAKGRVVDKRTDIWAFGCVLYEMLTGRRPFEGEDVSDTLAAVLRGDPNWSTLPSATPPQIRTLLRRCLQKDPKKRLPHIGIARLEIDEDASHISTRGAEPEPAATWRRLVPYAIAAMVASLLTLAAVWRPTGAANPRLTLTERLTITLPPTAAAQPTFGGPAVSADGTRIVYVGSTPDGGRALYLRLLDQLEPRPLPGTENAGDPFFSPDGESVAFFTGTPGSPNQTLKTVAVRGGAAVTIATMPGLSVGGSWGTDGEIRVASTPGPVGGPGQFHSVYVVPGSGGSARPIPALTATKDRSYGWPDVLPDGRHMLVSVRTGQTYSESHIDVTSLDGKSVRTVVENGYHARYVSSGHIVYMFARDLLAVPFDLSQLKTTGPPVMIAEKIGLTGSFARGQEPFDVSQTGMLVYGDFAAAGNLLRRAMVWVDRKGSEEPIGAPYRAYAYPRISPDGSRVAIDLRDEGYDIWIWDFNRRSLSRITSDPAQDTYPVWMPDGRLAFTSQRASGGGFNVFIQNADGTGDPEQLTEGSLVRTSNSITPDGTQLIVRDQSEGADDLVALSLKDRSTSPNPRPMTALVRTKFNERNGEVSPDGRWLAYQSDESGREEIYVRPFPNTDAARWTISSDGGSRPVWARNGRELFYVAGQTPLPVRMMRVAIDTTKGFSATVPQQLFEGRYYVDRGPTVRGRTYDIAPDGQRFLMIKDASAGESAPSPVSPPLVIVLNWPELLNAHATAR
jgi:serine/threonine-protein kinase